MLTEYCIFITEKQFQFYFSKGILLKRILQPQETEILPERKAPLFPLCHQLGPFLFLNQQPGGWLVPISSHRLYPEHGKARLLIP